MDKERRNKLAMLLLDLRSRVIKKESFDLLDDYIKQIEALFEKEDQNE